MKRLSRLLHRHRPEPQPGLQGEEHEALEMARRAAHEREAFAENVIRKAGHKSHPYLDDPDR